MSAPQRALGLKSSRPPRFVHLTFKFHVRPKTTELEPVFNKARDWVRYAPNCWILWTNVSATSWYERLKPFLDSEDNVLICLADFRERSGFLPKWIWKWIRDKEQVNGAEATETRRD